MKIGQQYSDCSVNRHQRTINSMGKHCKFPHKHMGNTLWGISLIQRRESTIPTIKYPILIHSACQHRDSLVALFVVECHLCTLKVM